jgi:hypothetical protein
MLSQAITHAQLNAVSQLEMGVATLAAGLALLSNGMNDEQVRAMIEQAFQYTAPVRRNTEARWKRSGFDPYAGEAPGKLS